MIRVPNSFIVVIIILTFSTINAQTQPPYSDYCEMVARDIQGNKHGFIAGNLLYYVGGQASAEWDILEHETLGFTHGFFRDGRSRGHGIITDEYGTGNDKWGWEFYRKTKIAYGSVISGTKYTNPIPIQMIWRPDKTTCVYSVGGVTVTEKKFITNNDVLVSIITSSQPVTLEFEGSSFVNTGFIPTWDGDPGGIPFSQIRSAIASFDSNYNAIHIIEDGTVMVKPNWGTPAVEGDLMYDGMHVVLSSNADISTSNSISRDSEGRQNYSFQIPCDENGVAIAFAMGDDYENTVTRVDSVLSDPEAYLFEKTDYMNDLLNEQIPYFRCSDEQVEQVYYYLWSLYFMYYIDVGKGWEKYPHTQTAVNNFMGLHNFDAYAFIPIGSWARNKEYFAYGNALTWKFLLPYKNDLGMLPDNLGIDWYSPVWMSLNGHVEGSWQIFEHSGDVAFLDSIYTFYRELYWQGITPNWGIGINALDILITMANELGQSGDTTHWQSMKDDMLPGWYAGWDNHNFYGFSSSKDILNLASMMYYGMPDEWARKMVNNWAMNSEVGYLDEVPLKIRAKDSPQIPPFNVSTLSTYLAVEGMFRHHCDEDAIFCTLGHINGMVKDFGYPVTPEAWDENNDPWGDMYYNWDGAMLLLLIEQIGGIHYSFADSTFIVSDHLPKSWEFEEWYIPIVKGGETEWTHVRIDRNKTGSDVTKSITVSGNSQDKLYIQPWLEDRELLMATPMDYDLNNPSGHAGFSFGNAADASVSLTLGINQKPTGIFLDSNTISENSPIGTVIDVLRSKDQDAGDTHSYSFARGGNNEDSTSFMIFGDTLKSAEIFDYEVKSIYELGIRSTDNSGSYYEEYFNIRVEDGYEGPDTTVTDTLTETFTGPDFDLGQAPEGYWDLEGVAGTFNGSGQYTISTNSDFVGLTGDIGQGSFEAIVDVDSILWTADYSKVVWGIYDGDANAFIYFVEKGNTWMSLIVDLVTEAGNTRPVNVPISTPNAVKLRIQWTEETKDWRVWYGLNGAEPTIEPSGSPITTYPVTSQIERFTSIGVGQWNEGAVSAELDYFRIIRDMPITSIDQETSQIPEQFSLSQNYPNPFNPMTKIRFTLPQTEDVLLIIYDLLGRRIKTLVNNRLQAGQHMVEWDGKDDTGNQVSSGLYFYQIQCADYTKVRKMLLVR